LAVEVKSDMQTLMDHNCSVPLYKQIVKSINRKITTGEYPINSRIPSEVSLMEEYGVSRITIRTAITELVEDGVLERIQGKGTFVNSPKSLYQADDRIGFSRSCQMSGKIPKTELLKIEKIIPSESIGSFLGIPDGDHIICSKRLRYVDDYPTMIETNYYPLKFEFLFSENLNNSLFAIMAKHGLYIGDAIRTLEVCTPTREEIAILGLSTSKALLLFKDKQFDKEGKPLFFSKQIYRTDRMKFYL